VRNRLERVRAESLRVALISMGITAAAFAIVSLIIVMYVSNTLTAQVDSRLTTALTNAVNGHTVNVSANALHDSRSRFGPLLLGWEIRPSGEVIMSDPSAPLPVPIHSVESPRTVTIQGIDVRVAGTPVGGDYVVLGQSLDSVAQARSTIIVGELIVGSVLLVLVFLGALAVGRRVGAPIELARQRQLEFTADASHELRTPLSVIEAQTSLALTQDRERDWYQQAFRRVAGESQRIRRLVEDLLWLARVDTPGNAPSPEPVDVSVLARQAVERFATVAEARGLHLALRVSDEQPVINASSEWIDRLLGVLLDNACKYAPRDGRVEVAIGVDGKQVRLVVEDSGPGIPLDERSKIFNRFHRASDVPGTGLGLAIADAVVRLTQGRWEIGTSQQLRGASMAVVWPRALGAGRQAARAPAAVPQAQH
jgi:signal transduction histidine kinase